MKKFSIAAIFFLMLFAFSCSYKEKDKTAEKAVFTRRAVNLNDLGKDMIVSLDQKVFEAVMSGKIKAYEADTLTPKSQLTVQKIREKIDRTESTTIYPNPNSPEYGVDTTIVKPFKTEDIVGHSIGEKWLIGEDGATFKGELHAFSINWKPVIANIELQEQPVFWISFSDLEKLLTPAEIKSLKKNLNDAMAKRLSDY